MEVPQEEQSPRSAGLDMLSRRADVLAESQQTEFCCKSLCKWGHHRIRVTDHGIEIQRTSGPFDIALCTQKQNVGIPHAKIGRFRTTWSSASMLKPVQFLLEGLLVGLLYSMIKNDSLSTNSIQVAGCDVTNAAEYERCAGGVQIDVGMVNQEHVQGDTGKIMIGIAVFLFVVRTGTWILSRVAMLEVCADGVPEEDSWVYFPGDDEKRKEIQTALMDQQYKVRGKEGRSTDGDPAKWGHRGETLTLGQHHIHTVAVCSSSSCGGRKDKEEVMATYDAARFLHLAIAGRTCRHLILGTVLLSVALGILAFVFIQASGTATSGVTLDNFLVKAEYNATEWTKRVTISVMIIGALGGLWSWTQSAVSFVEFGIDFETGASNANKALSAAGLTEQTVRVAIPKHEAPEIKATYLHRQLHPDIPSTKLLKQFRGQTGDNMSLSILSIYEDRVELDIKSYCHWKLFASLRGLCRYCEKGESYTVLLRDIEYVKTGYIGSPILWYAGVFMCIFGFLVLALAPTVIAKMGSATPAAVSAVSAVALSSYSDERKTLYTTLAVCEGLALLLWTWYLWRKRSVIHLGIRPGGGEHGKINPYGSASPFFIVFKTLKGQKDDDIMATILSQRDLQAKDKHIRVVRDSHSDGPEEELPPPPPIARVEPVYTPPVVEPPPRPIVRDWRNATNAAKLPMAWKRLKDGKGRDYFFNVVTQKSQWTLPEEIAKEQQQQAATWVEDNKAQVEIEI